MTDRIELETARAAALARYVRRVAQRNQFVWHARKALFGSAVEAVSRDRALALLRSPATRFVRESDLVEHGVPWPRHRASVERETPGHSEEATWTDLVLRVAWGRQNEVRLKARVTHDDALGHEPGWFTLPGTSRPERVAVHPGTVLARIVRAARLLVEAVEWTEAEAVLFLLTDEAPEPPAVQFDLVRPPEGAPSVVLRVQPFADARSVLEAYRRAQVRLDGVKTFRQRRRPLALRAVHLFDFVSERRPALSWEQVRQKWNRARPSWTYDDARTMRRDYALARGRLLANFRDAGRDL